MEKAKIRGGWQPSEPCKGEPPKPPTSGSNAVKGLSVTKPGRPRPCEVKGRPAFFHTFSTIAYVVSPSPLVGGHPGGQISQPCAIVEYPDGSVEEVDPVLVKFVDRECAQ